ncbi:hypothetical protein EST92_10460 [Streptomyces sp. TM32]|uniref:EamA family transporter n=1 Tax=Streptomyces sp. TM32 TaxID=1652669 RepID=UPI00101130C8|nr:EamA family transporter [Streptomyces sp. TM32]RXS84651.1 hypothetical protein EST92_10460 [Streptomyces sp. TM32]
MSIVASVLLQATVYGLVSGRLGAADSLALSCAGFGTAAVVFNVVLLVRRRGGGAVAQSERVTGPLLAMNALTAVTFLGFYAALSWIPSGLATAIETTVGPLAVALLGLAGVGRRPTGRAWAGCAALVVFGLAVAWRFTGTADLGSITGLAGIGLAVLAGTGAALLALVSADLGRRGVDPVRVTAHRFHLTYLCGGVLLAATGGAGHRWAAGLPALVATGVLAVTIPLFLLQRGLQRTDPMVAMVLLTTLPGATYLAETAFHGGFDPATLALICCLVAAAAWYARSPRPASGRSGVRQSSAERVPAVRQEQ